MKVRESGPGNIITKNQGTKCRKRENGGKGAVSPVSLKRFVFSLISVRILRTRLGTGMSFGRKHKSTLTYVKTFTGQEEVQRVGGEGSCRGDRKVYGRVGSSPFTGTLRESLDGVERILGSVEMRDRIGHISIESYM